MKLSELALAADIEVRRDADFRSVGLTFYETDALLAALYDRRYLHECRRNPSLAAVLTTPELADEFPAHCGVACCADPQRALLAAHRYLAQSTDFYGADFPTEIDRTAQLDPTAVIAEKNVRIGPGVVIGPRAVILPGVSIGVNCGVGPGVILGAEGFSPAPPGSSLRVVPHSGPCRIGEEVEIQANSVVCRGFFSASTSIGDGSVLSSLVNISHNVQIGRGARIGSSSCILGSARLGDDVRVGPNATVSNRIRLGNGVRVSLGAVVVRDAPAGQTVSGNFAMEHGRFLSWFRRTRSQMGKD